MGLMVKESGGGEAYPVAPEGTHPAVCLVMIDKGIQHDEKYGNDKPKVLLGFELHSEERRTDGKPHMVWQTYTASLNEKAILRQHLDSWRGRAFNDAELEQFDLRNVLGVPCLLTIIHNKNKDKTYANIGGIVSMPKGMPKPRAEGDICVFDLDDPDWDVFDEFSDTLKKQIRAAKNYPGDHQTPGKKDAAEADLGDIENIPF